MSSTASHVCTFVDCSALKCSYGSLVCSCSYARHYKLRMETHRSQFPANGQPAITLWRSVQLLLQVLSQRRRICDCYGGLEQLTLVCCFSEYLISNVQSSDFCDDTARTCASYLLNCALSVIKVCCFGELNGVVLVVLHFWTSFAAISLAVVPG